MGTTNTLDLNNRVDKLEKAVSGGDSAQANKKDIATEFNATTAYTAGCFVYHDGKLYQFNADHAAGAWDPTDVVEANVTDQVVSNAAAIAGLTAADVAYGTGSVEDALPKVTDWYTIPDDITVTSSGWAAIVPITVFGLTADDANRVINIQLASLDSAQKPFLMEAANNINGVLGVAGVIHKNQKIRLIYI